MPVRGLDLFCGGGGSSWGAQAAGVEVACGVDAWDIATKTFESNFPGAKVLTRTLTERSGPDLLGDVGSIDLILASPECTNHTCAKGNRPRDENSKRTARYVLNFARELRPRWIVLENVVHMRSWHGYDPLVEALEKLGYNVRRQVLDAADFSVPQSRRRLFLICDNQRMPDLVESPQRSRTPARHILSSAGKWPSRPLRTDGRAPNTLERANRAIEALGPSKPFLIVYYGSDGSGGWQPLTRPLRTLTTLDRFGLVTWKKGEPYLRMLQVPELQRAMGFDDGYRLDHGTRRDKIRLLGNGVCPPVMKAVVESLIGSDLHSPVLAKSPPARIAGVQPGLSVYQGHN